MGIKNLFKKAGQGVSNIFKKVDSGATNFFKKLPDQVNSAVGATASGLNKGLDVVGDTARKVGNTLEKAAPIVGAITSVVAPEIGIPLMAGLTSATALSKQVQSGARQGQAVTNQLAQQVTNKANSVIGQAQKGFANGSANLQNRANNALMKGNMAVNNTVNQAKAGYNNAVAQAAGKLTIH